MKLKGATWIMLAALVAIAAYFFLVDEKGRETRERQRRSSRKLFSYTRAEVERFVLINSKGERIEVARSGSDWKVVSPVDAPGDQPEIASFLDQVVPGRRGVELTGARNLADYGLEKPFATLILYRTGAAAPETLLVGDKTPTSSNSYVRLGSAGSILISSELTHTVMNKSLFHLRDKNFMPPGSESISAVAIRNMRETLNLKKRGGYWWFASRNMRADRARVESYLSRLTDAVIHRFVREDTEDLAPYGLKTPAEQITLTKGSETLTVSFGKKEDYLVNVVRTGLDKVIMLEASLLEPFEWNTENLRAMNLAFFQEDSLRTIRYETPDTSVVFIRTGTAWSTTGAGAAAIRPWEVSGLMHRLESTTFTKIINESFSGEDTRLRRYLVRVTLEDGGGDVLDRITIASPAKDAEIGASISAGAVGSLKQGTAEELEAIFKRIGAR
jgi:hypothetical protein